MPCFSSVQHHKYFISANCSNVQTIEFIDWHVNDQLMITSVLQVSPQNHTFLRYLRQETHVPILFPFSLLFFVKHIYEDINARRFMRTQNSSKSRIQVQMVVSYVVSTCFISDEHFTNILITRVGNSLINLLGWNLTYQCYSHPCKKLSLLD